MPAYAKNLSPDETTALVAFLKTLHPSVRHLRATRPVRSRSQCPETRPRRGEP